MTITRLDPADSVAMGQWYDLMVAVTRQDLPDFPTPSQQEHTARFEQPWPASSVGRLPGDDSEEHLDGIHHDPEVRVNCRLIRLFFLSCTSAAMSDLRRKCRGRNLCGR